MCKNFGAAFLVGQLQDALRVANAIEAILILDMIEAAAKLKLRVEAMLSAKEEADSPAE